MEARSERQQRVRTVLQVISALSGRNYGRKVQHMSRRGPAFSSNNGSQPSVRAAGGNAVSLGRSRKVENQYSSAATHASHVVDLARLRRFTDSESLKKDAHSHAYSLQPQGSHYMGKSQQVPFRPSEISTESTSPFTLREAVGDPYPYPGARNREAVQGARRSTYKVNIRPLVTGAKHSQRSKSVTQGRTRCGRSLLKNSFLSSPPASHQNSGPSSRSVSPPHGGGAPIQPVSQGSSHLCLYPVDTPRSKNLFHAISARDRRRSSGGARRLSASPSPSGPSVRTRKSTSPQGESGSASQPLLPDSIDKVWHEVLSNASPALIQLAKELLGEHLFQNKSSVSERDAKGTRQPSLDVAGATDDSEVQNAKHESEENSTPETCRLPQMAGQPTTERVCVLDGIVLPDAARRFLLANLLFLRDNHEYFSVWAELHTAHQQLIRLSPSVPRGDTLRAKAVSRSKEQSDHSSPARILEEEQPVPQSDPVHTPTSYGETTPAGRSGPNRNQGNRAACLVRSLNGSGTLSGVRPLEHQTAKDAGAQHMMPPEELSEVQSGAASRSSSQPFEDSEDISATEFCRASSFHHEILHISEDEEEGPLGSRRWSTEAAQSTQVQSGLLEAGKSSSRFSHTHECSGSMRFYGGGSTGERVQGGEKGSCTLGCTIVAQKSDQARAVQFDAVVVRLKSAATKSRASIHALRSELISAQAITEGPLLSIIFRLFHFGTLPTPSTTVLPLVAGAYVFILASLMEARKRCCQLLVACCNSLYGILESQVYKTERLQRELPRWGKVSANLTRQIETLNSSTLKLTSLFVAEAKQAFINILAIMYPFASLLHAHRLRKRQIRERARQRRLIMRRAELGSLAVKCQNELADLQLREGRYRRRLAAALKIQQDAAARAEDLSVSILNLRKEELKLHSSGRASRDPGRLLGLQAKLEHLVKQRERQEREMAVLEDKSQQARELMAAIQMEQQRSTETKRQLEQERAALRNERKSLQRMFVQSKEGSVRHHADLLGVTDKSARFHATAKLCKVEFPDARSDAEGQLRCIAELTQLVVRALKLHGKGTMACHTGSAREADIALLSKAYRQYLRRAGKENDFRHTLLSCTPSGSIENGIDSIAKPESEASFGDDDRSLSMLSSRGSIFGRAESSIHVENGSAQEAGRTENTRSRPGEPRGMGGESLLGNVCEAQRVQSLASFPSSRIRSSGGAAACSASKYTSVGRDEGPNIDSNAMTQLLEEPMLVARLTVMQVMGAATIAPLSHISGPAWELMDEMLVAYNEPEIAD